jgi:hypothetical protein
MEARYVSPKLPSFGMGDSGIPKAEAMGLARVIIPELIAAVKKDGAAALYQKGR